MSLHSVSFAALNMEKFFLSSLLSVAHNKQVHEWTLLHLIGRIVRFDPLHNNQTCSKLQEV